MKKLFTLFNLIFVAWIANAQVNVTFESLSLPTSNYWNGNIGVAALTSFQNNGATFYNRNDTSSFGDYWSGWGYSATTDTTSILYSNQMSCIAGKGHNNSNVYGVAYLSPDEKINKIKFNASYLVNGFYLTNTTIAYRSMQNGDGFAKKFGGATGNDPDFYRIDITGWNGGNPINDTVQFYLADFRDTNNANDYIIKDWTFVDLSSFGFVDSLTYTLASSDTSSFGINTPTYFCLDDINLFPVEVNDLNASSQVTIYPNPVHETIYLTNNSSNKIQVNLYSIIGTRILKKEVERNETFSFNMNLLAKGNYMFQIVDGNNVSYEKITHE